MKTNIDIDRIVKYLEPYKAQLPALYKWEFSPTALKALPKLTDEERKNLLLPNTPYDKAISLKRFLGQKLRDSQKEDINLFSDLCFWLIKDWGGIKTGDHKEVVKSIHSFCGGEPLPFARIASSSKIAAFMYPKQHIIYDARVAYSINWIMLSEKASEYFFPIPTGRNSKMAAFDMPTLIRLHKTSVYQTSDIETLEAKRFINDRDKNVFISESEAYAHMNDLVKQISQQLWQGDAEKQSDLFYTEMLLFSIADREIFRDIVQKSTFSCSAKSVGV